jgi:predicted GTPase
MPDRPRARPSPELVAAQWRAKAAWHQQQAQRPVTEKISLLLEMQRQLHPILCQRRPPRAWERPWDIEP